MGETIALDPNIGAGGDRGAELDAGLRIACAIERDRRRGVPAFVIDAAIGPSIRLREEANIATSSG